MKPEMTNSTTSTSSLERAFAGVADNYRGSDVDLNAVYAVMRRDSPVIAENFMAGLGVPNIAGLDANRPTFTVFKYRDVMAVLRDATNFTSGFIAEGLGAFFDGLILTGMDGEEFADKALREAGVVTIPGSSFGPHCKNYIRTACTVPEEMLEEASQRIRNIPV